MRPHGAPNRKWGLAWLIVTFVVLSTLVAVPEISPSARAASWSGPEPTPTNLTVFLHNSTSPLAITGGIFSSLVMSSTNDTAVPWTLGGQVDTSLQYLTVPFFLYPRTAGSLALNDTPVADVFINQTCVSCPSAFLTFTLYSADPSGVLTRLGTPGTVTFGAAYAGNVGLPIRVPYGSPLLTSLPPGWSLKAVFSFTGSNTQHFGFWWGKVAGTYYPSDINLPASTYLAVNETYLVGAGGQIVSALNPSATTPVVSLRANVTDPLGNYDYDNWTVDWTILNATGAVKAQGALAPYAPSAPPLFYGYNETYAARYNYSALSLGAYTFCANATDNTYHNDLLFAGNYFGRSASGCTQFFVGTAPNLLTLHVLDSEGRPLAGARVVVASILNLTDVTGVTHFLLANGSYAATVTWENIQVAHPSISVLGATTRTVVTRVYYPTFSIVDQAGVALSNALVYVVHPNGTRYPLAVTGASGNLSYAQVPAGAYGITVIWHDSVVYGQPAQPAITVAGNVSYAVLTQVFYQSFQIIQPGGTPIPLASVLVENSTTGVLVSFGITNATGVTTSRVPAGTFTVLVYWQTGLVATVPTLALPATTNPYVITASLYAVTFHAVDAKGIAVAGAEISVDNAGGHVTTLVTDAQGTAGVVLPGGSYAFTTSWEGVVVNTTSAMITSSTTLSLDLSIYYLTVNVTDNSGAPLSGVFLQVVSQSTGATVASTTSTSQAAVFRLPAGQYVVTGTYHGTFDLSPVNQAVNATVSLTSSKGVTLDFTAVNPPFTSTAEFPVVLGFVLLAVALALLALLLFRRRRPKAPASSEPGLPEAGPPSPPEQPRT